jgi:hypothetical protein
MTKDDITRMAKEAGFCGFDGANKCLREFANLVAVAERNRTWTQDHWTEYERSIAATEREACAKVAESYEPRCDTCPSGVSNAIRARGQE